MTFENLGLIDPILKALKDKNYEKPTEIQANAIPLVLKRNDVIGSAQTGTGKTAAFAIPIIQLIHKIESSQNKKPVLRSLIVTPTRELAIQIDENIKDYSKYTNIKHAVIFGGVKQHSQVQRLKKGIHILTATPGRLIDLHNQGFINFDDIKIFVLDEADRMLDMGFIRDINLILKMLPKQKQSLFFSATMPPNIIKLSNQILNNPKKIAVDVVSSAAETIKQFVYFTNKKEKQKLLLHILKDESKKQVLVFCRTKHGSNRVATTLNKKNIKAQAIHGDKSQNSRQNALQKFKEGSIRVLVATDIAARGIDIDKLENVINYDIPNVSETYVHRIGRSGRAGENGISISIAEPEENAYVRDIEKLINKKIEVVEDHPFPQTEKPMTNAEKKEFEKEKQRRKQEFFANRKKKKEQGGGKKFGGRNSNSNSGKKKSGNKNFKSKRRM